MKKKSGQPADRQIRVILFGTWAEENLGDDLMLCVQIKNIRERHPGAFFVIPTGKPDVTRNLLKQEGIPLENVRLIYTGRWGFREPGKPLLRSLAWIFDELRELFRADLLLIGPGNQIQDVTRRYRALFFIFRGLVAWFFRTPYAYFGLGYYTLSSRLCRGLLRFTANRSVFVSTRDSGGAVDFIELGVRPVLVHGLSDVSFTYAWSEAAKKGESEMPPTIGITSRIFLPEIFPADVTANFETCYAELLKQIHRDIGAHFRFFPFYRGSEWHDLVARDRILDTIGDPDFPMETVPFQTLAATRDQMLRCDAFIGVRYHSVLISIQNSLPVMAMGYGKKTWRFMTENGLAAYVLPVEDITADKLKSMWNRLWDNRIAFSETAAAACRTAEAKAQIHFDLIEMALSGQQEERNK